jgi:hypothetical protein
VKGKPTEWGKHQIIYVIRDLHLEYIKESWNSVFKKIKEGGERK